MVNCGVKRLLVSAVVVLALAVPGVVNAAGPLDGLTIPTSDPSLTFVAPTPDQPNYDARLDAFLSVTVPDTWNGAPVAFLQTYNEAGGVDVLGLPTSLVQADPHNPNFVYQRFQNGVLFYNASDGTTAVLPAS
jgi:uncharacterized protein with LGFP repeats